MQEIQNYLILTALALFIIISFTGGSYIIKLALFPYCEEQKEMVVVRIILGLGGLLINSVTAAFVCHLIQVAIECCSK